MSAFDDYLNAPASQAGQSFDAYVGTPSVPASAAGGTGAAAPKTAAGQPGMLASLGAGLGHGVQQAALGTQQLLGHGASAIGLNTIGDWLTKDAQQGLAKGNAEYAPYSAAHPFVAGAGDIGGQIAGTAPTMLMGPEFAGLSLAGKIGLGAAQGAAGAAMMPTDGQNFWSDKAKQVGVGAGLGAALPAAFAGARAAGNGLWNVVQPVVQPGRFVGQGLAGAMDPAEAALAAQNIRGAQQFVPGSTPTTAQAAQTPVMVQTEKAAGNIPAFKTGSLQRGIENNDARWQALMGVAQDPSALAAADAARQATSAPLYAAAHASSAPADPTLLGLMQRPSVQSAMRDAEKLAQDEGATLQWPTAKNPAINGQALDYLGRAMNDQIGTAQRSGSSQLVRAITKNQEAIDQWGQANIPAIAKARQAYAAGSVPVNTMEAGQAIANGLGTRAMNAGGVPEIQMMPYRSALQSAMKNSPYGIDANALQSLQGIGQDLQRATVSNSIRSPGSDTAYNLAANGWLARNIYGPNFQGATGIGKTAAALGALATGHPLAAGGIFAGGNRIGQMVGNRLQNHLSGLLLNPDTVLPYLDARASAAAQAVPNPVVQGLLNYGRPAITNGLAGGLINANQ